MHTLRFMFALVGALRRGRTLLERAPSLLLWRRQNKPIGANCWSPQARMRKIPPSCTGGRLLDPVPSCSKAGSGKRDMKSACPSALPLRYSRLQSTRFRSAPPLPVVIGGGFLSRFFSVPRGVHTLICTSVVRIGNTAAPAVWCYSLFYCVVPGVM